MTIRVRFQIRGRTLVVFVLIREPSVLEKTWAAMVNSEKPMAMMSFGPSRITGCCAVSWKLSSHAQQKWAGGIPGMPDCEYG